MISWMKSCRNPRTFPIDHLMQYVKDRPGHDRRYAMNVEKIKNELGWTPRHDLQAGLQKTITWYLENAGLDVHPSRHKKVTRPGLIKTIPGEDKP